MEPAGRSTRAGAGQGLETNTTEAAHRRMMWVTVCDRCTPITWTKDSRGCPRSLGSPMSLYVLFQKHSIIYFTVFSL